MTENVLPACGEAAEEPVSQEPEATAPAATAEAAEPAPHGTAKIAPGAPEPPPVSQPPAAASVEPAPQEADILTQIKLLNRRFSEQERLSTERERVIDRLHEENQKLKAGELLKQMSPVYRDLMRLYDDLERTAGGYAGLQEISPEKAAGDWRFFATAVMDLLYRYGVDVMPVAPGAAFEAKQQRAAAVKKTDERELDRTVFRVLAAGFTADGRVLRPAAVEVFRFEAALVEPPVAAPEPVAEEG